MTDLTAPDMTATDPTQLAALRAFLVRHRHSHLDVLVDALAAQCARHGCWMPPSRDAGRCGTHLHEITLWVVEGKGATPMEAARSWRSAALARLAAATEVAA